MADIFELPINEEFLEEIGSSEDSSIDYGDDKLNGLYRDMEADIDDYLRIGQFCFMSLEEWDRTSTMRREILAKKINERLKPYIDEFAKRGDGGEGKGMMPLNYFHLAIMLSLSSLGGGDK
jgi:hypothetical protein